MSAAADGPTVSQPDTAALNNPNAGRIKAGFIKADFIPVFRMCSSIRWLLELADRTKSRGQN
jgi:hypothetical protein